LYDGPGLEAPYLKANPHNDRLRQQAIVVLVVTEIGATERLTDCFGRGLAIGQVRLV
jgi:hypothetical protein